MKKIIAILLVVTLMSALFVVPAHAHEADEVTPRSMLCDDPGGCNQPMAHRTSTYRRNYTYIASCDECDYAHNHYTITYRSYYICVNTNCNYYNKPYTDSFYTLSQVYCDYTDSPVN